MTLDANTLGHMVDEKLFHLEAERDEALSLAATQGRQLAALREAVDHYMHGGKPGADLHGELRKAFDDTAAAAAQYRWVDEWHVVVRFEDLCFAVGFAQGCFGDRSKSKTYPDWLTALSVAAAPNLSSVAEGEAGEKEGV